MVDLVVIQNRQVVTTSLQSMEQVPTVPREQMKARSLLNCLCEYGDVLNAESSNAIQAHAVELLTGKSLPKPEPFPIIDKKDWYTAREISQMANVTVQRIVWLAKNLGIDSNPNYCKQHDPLLYNEKGKTKLLMEIVNSVFSK